MVTKLGLLTLILLMQFSCLHSVDVRKGTSNNESNLPLGADTPAEDPSGQLIEADRFTIYHALLTRIVADKEYQNILCSLDGVDMLVYASQTILPPNMSRTARPPSGISAPLFDDFISATKARRYLQDSYGVKASVLVISGARDVEDLFKMAKRKYPDTKAAVAFSNIGINRNYSQGVLYMECYCPDKGLMKFYVLMNFSKRGDSAYAGKLDGVSDFTFIPAN